MIGGVASNMAADKQAAGGEKALAAQGAQMQMNKMELDPFRNVGVQSLGALQQGLGIGTGFGGADGYTMGGLDMSSPLLKPFSLSDFQASPAYQFNLQQGTDAINKAASARGQLYNPATLQDIGKFTQGVASNEFQNAFNNYNQNQGNIFSRLLQMSNQGLSAGQAIAGVNTPLAQAQGQTQMSIGNAQGAGVMGVGNAIQGGIGDMYNAYMQRQILNQMQAGQYGGGAGGGGSFGP